MGKIKEIFEPLINAIRPMIEEKEIEDLESTLEQMESEKLSFISDLDAFDDILSGLKIEDLEDDDDLWAAIGGWTLSLAKGISDLGSKERLNKHRAQYYVEQLRALSTNGDKKNVSRLKLLLTQIRGDNIKW